MPTAYCPHATTCPYASCGPAMRQTFLSGGMAIAEEQRREDDVDEEARQLAPAGRCVPEERVRSRRVALEELDDEQPEEPADDGGGEEQLLRPADLRADGLPDEEQQAQDAEGKDYAVDVCLL